MRQHQIIEARIGVAGRRVFVVGMRIADFAAAAGAFMSMERVAVGKAHDRHGLPLVEVKSVDVHRVRPPRLTTHPIRPRGAPIYSRR
jgi:hypothetical protein